MEFEVHHIIGLKVICTIKGNMLKSLLEIFASIRANFFRDRAKTGS